MTNKSKLLVVGHSYNNFQKDIIESLSGFFESTNVLVRTNPFAKISNSFPLPQLERFKNGYKIDLADKPININVIPTPVWYFPCDINYRMLGIFHYKRVKDTIKKENIKCDFIHSHFTWSAGYVGARLKEELGIKFVLTAHGYDIYSLPFKDSIWKEKIEYVLNNASHITTVSESNLAHIRKLKVSTPVTIIPNGFKADLFYPSDYSHCKKNLSLPSEKKIILTVGNLVPVKGQCFLIEAISHIVKKRKDILCIIIGTGELYANLMRQIKILKLEGHVKLLGNMPHKAIPTWINACDLFVLPSINEGNPTVMFEALGCGKPFLGTKVGGMPEIIVSEECGLLVEPSNSLQLAEAIVDALNRNWDRNLIRQYAGKFSWDNVAKQYEKVFNNI